MRRSQMLLGPGAALVIACTALPDRERDTIEVSGDLRFDLYQASRCEVVGPSPVGSCSRGHYSGGLEGTGYYAVQSMQPTTPDGVLFITENEVLRLADGELYGRVNAAYHSKSPDGEVSSLHTITGGTGRYAGASGYIRLWRAHGERFEYAAVIHLAAPEPIRR
jgi:hypothetical protein